MSIKKTKYNTVGCSTMILLRELIVKGLNLENFSCDLMINKMLMLKKVRFSQPTFYWF